MTWGRQMEDSVSIALLEKIEVCKREKEGMETEIDETEEKVSEYKAKIQEAEMQKKMLQEALSKKRKKIENLQTSLAIANQD